MTRSGVFLVCFWCVSGVSGVFLVCVSGVFLVFLGCVSAGGLDFLVLNHIGNTPFSLWDGDSNHVRTVMQVRCEPITMRPLVLAVLLGAVLVGHVGSSLDRVNLSVTNRRRPECL